MNIPDISMEMVTGPDDLSLFRTWLHDAMRNEETIAIDTETVGLDWHGAGDGFVRLVQFGSPSSGWAVPVETYRPVAAAALRDLAQAQYPVVMHNAKFDMHALAAAGLPLPNWSNVIDTMILHHLHNSAARHGLKPAAAAAFGSWARAGEGALHAEMKRNGWDWATVPVDLPAYWAYGVLDTCITARLFDLLYPDTPLVPFDREMQYLSVMWHCEGRGMDVDVEYASRLREAYTTEAQALCESLRSAGIANPNSNRMVEATLADLGWVPQERTETGQAKLDKVVLARLIELGGPKGEIASALVRYKRLVKWTAAYLDPFIESGGCVYPSINTMAARTGRSSITNPALQTLPHTPDIRRAVIPASGNDLWSIDYAGQEARIFAHYAREDKMRDVFLHGDGDMHALVARMVYGEGFTPEQRYIAKTVNFALLYGAGPAKIAQSAGVPVMEIKRFLAMYHKAFPSVQRFMSDVPGSVADRRAATGTGYVQTMGGRRVVVDDGKDYTGVNYLIQGSGADVLKEAVCRLDDAGLADCIIAPVHDELVVQLPHGERPDAVRSLMENHEWFDVPITTDCDGPFQNWGQAYE